MWITRHGTASMIFQIGSTPYPPVRKHKTSCNCDISTIDQSRRLPVRILIILTTMQRLKFLEPRPIHFISLFMMSRSFTYPDSTITKIVRKAGKMIPTKLEWKNFNKIICIRNMITVWFQKRIPGMEAWTGTYSSTLLTFSSDWPQQGVLLLGPPFRPLAGEYNCMPSEVRNFMTVPSLRNPPPEEGISTHNSTGDAFAYHLELKFENNPQLLEIAIKDAFFILSDLYGLVASTWMVANEYLNRECTYDRIFVGKARSRY